MDTSEAVDIFNLTNGFELSFGLSGKEVDFDLEKYGYFTANLISVRDGKK